ncbi:MAG: hypothetical protein QGF59_18395 [Pirellulaceae bacterium]|nr:hypothetical protein [Pirellulaceae bacterium]
MKTIGIPDSASLLRLGTSIALLILNCTCGNSRADEDRIIAACRQYLSAQGASRAAAAAELSAFKGDIDEVLSVLTRTAAPVQGEVSGVVANQPFSCPDLFGDHSQDMLHFFVPSDCAPTTLFELIIFMHGGGRTTPPEHARHVVTHPNDDPGSVGLQPHVAAVSPRGWKAESDTPTPASWMEHHSRNWRREDRL